MAHAYTPGLKVLQKTTVDKERRLPLKGDVLVEAGKKVGCKTIFIDYKYNETKPKNPNFITDSLLNAVYIIEKN